MPRNGDGSSDNGPIEAGHNIVHGAGGDDSLNRVDKVAPLPEGEKGAALPGMNASGGGSAGIPGPTGQGSSASDSSKDQASK